MKKKKILVIGGTGFIGYHLISNASYLIVLSVYLKISPLKQEN